MLQEFVASIGKRGFAKPSLFRAEITRIPQALESINGMSEALRDLPLFIETGEMPGTQVLTQELRHYDLTQKFAYMKAHDDLNIQIRMDRDFIFKRFFDEWVNAIYNPATGDSYYKSQYAGTVQIFQMNERGASSYGIELEDAFPTQIGQVSLGWDQSGNYIRLPVTLTFRRMKQIPNKVIFRPQGQQIGNGPSQGNSFPSQPPAFGRSNIEIPPQLRDTANLSTMRQLRVGGQSRLGNLTGNFNGVF